MDENNKEQESLKVTEELSWSKATMRTQAPFLTHELSKKRVLPKSISSGIRLSGFPCWLHLSILL